jgi:hypothetical protein
MHEFLTGRFTSYREGQFDAAVITHPDEDHYYGFKPIFEDPDLGFKTVYHSGLVERPVSGDFAKVGGKSKKDAKGLEWLTDLASTDEDIEQLFGNPDLQDTEFKYPQVMHAAAINPKVEHYRMLSTKDGKSEDGRTYMPDFAPSDDRGYTIEVLGPFVERFNGKKALRRIKSYGETKNGHSVLLRLQYGSFSVFFGGDLNAPAEEFLIKAYGGQAKAKERFGADVMKVCHHGSEKVTDAFISAVHPTCFVISSGDEEGHVHPRPDLLGRLGRLGRGSAPVLLSTELQRSTREKEDAKVVDRLLKGLDQIAAKPKDTKLRAKLAEDVKTLGRTNVSVDGTIYVKTDGERLIAAFKIEEGAELEKWFYFEYAFKDGELVLV